MQTAFFLVIPRKLLKANGHRVPSFFRLLIGIVKSYASIPQRKS